MFSTNHTLTQGSSLRSPTLGYQKQNPYGVRLSHEKRSLCAPLPFEREKIKKAQHRWRCAPCNTLTQGSSQCSPTLGYQKQNPYGVRLPNEKLSLCAPLPFEREVSPDMVFVISYRMWLRRRVNPTGVPFFIGQGWRAKRVTLPTDVCE